MIRSFKELSYGLSQLRSGGMYPKVIDHRERIEAFSLILRRDPFRNDLISYTAFFRA